MINLDQMLRDAETMRSSVRSIEGGADRVAAFHRLWLCLPELVDELEYRRRLAGICPHGGNAKKSHYVTLNPGADEHQLLIEQCGACVEKEMGGT